MNVNYIQQSVQIYGEFGNMLSTEESVILTNSLVVLQNENHFINVFFWGKIYGIEQDYYIAYGYCRDLERRTYYYSTDGMEWGLLPLPTERSLVLAMLCNTKFQGDPSVVIDVLIEDEDPTVPGVKTGGETKKLKEEDRLSAAVSLISEDVAVVPRGALFRKVDGVVVENKNFYGLGAFEAREVSSYLHFREPRRKVNTNLLEKDDYNYATDFLDPLDIDMPEGVWSIQVNQSQNTVILKSMFWPGFFFFHKLNTPKHGFVYFGHGKKSWDSVFALNPFLQTE